MARRHQRVAARLSSRPGSVAAIHVAGSDQPSPCVARKTSQQTTQARIAGNGQGRRNAIALWRRSTAGVMAEFVNQAVEFLQRTELDRNLAEFQHSPAAFDAFLHPHLNIGG